MTVSIPADLAQTALGAGNLASGVLRIDGRIVGATEEWVSTFLLQRANALLASQPDLIARLRGANDGAFDLASGDGNGTFAIRNSWRGGLWADIQGRWSREGLQRSDYPLGVIGADFVRTTRLLVGAMVQFDHVTDSDATGFMRGQGWLAGPYVAGQVGEHALYFEGRLLYGRTRIDLSIDNGATVSSFATERWLGSVRLSGAAP